MMLDISLRIEQGLSDDSNDHSVLYVSMEFPGLNVEDLPDELQATLLLNCVDRIHEAARALAGMPVVQHPDTSTTLASPA